MCANVGVLDCYSKWNKQEQCFKRLNVEMKTVEEELQLRYYSSSSEANSHTFRQEVLHIL